MRANYAPMKGGKWDHVSKDAKKFVESLLRLDPKRRPSARKALLEQKWMKSVDDTNVEAICCASMEHKRERTQRLALLMLMERISSDEILELQRVLQKYDPEETGWIAYTDVVTALKETGKLSTKELQKLLETTVPSENGPTKSPQCVDRVDFITTALEKRCRVESDRIIATFEELDKNRDGKISLQVCDVIVLIVVCWGRVKGFSHGNFSFCVQTLRDNLDEVIPSEWGSEFMGLTGSDGVVDRVEVMRWFGRKFMGRLESLQEEVDEDEKDTIATTPDVEELLVTPSNASIPGGRTDANAKPSFVYDEVSLSMRKVGEKTPR